MSTLSIILIFVVVLVSVITTFLIQRTYYQKEIKNIIKGYEENKRITKGNMGSDKAIQLHKLSYTLRLYAEHKQKKRERKVLLNRVSNLNSRILYLRQELSEANSQLSSKLNKTDGSDEQPPFNTEKSLQRKLSLLEKEVSLQKLSHALQLHLAKSQKNIDNRRHLEEISLKNQLITELKNEVLKYKTRYNEKLIDLEGQYNNKLKNQNLLQGYILRRNGVENKIVNLNSQFLLYNWVDTSLMNQAEQLKKMDKALLDRKNALRNVFSSRHKELADLKNEIKLATIELKTVNESIKHSLNTIYEDNYSLKDKNEFSSYIQRVKVAQADLKKYKLATNHLKINDDMSNWTIGKRCNNANIKQIIHFFNNECEGVINRLRINKYEFAEKQLRKSFHKLNELFAPNFVSLTEDYLLLKIEELRLNYENLLLREEEKEKQRRLLEIEREERRVQQEVQSKIKILREQKQKEQLQFKLALSDRFEEMTQGEIERYELRVKEIDREIEEADYRITNNKAGHVYIISNLGSFGERVFKIGVTRRLYPEERIQELNSASVPFKFDVHATIFSEDAFALERALHNELTDFRVNRINMRKEFFETDLYKIEDIVKAHYHKAVKFDHNQFAEDYWKSKALLSVIE